MASKTIPLLLLVLLSISLSIPTDARPCKSLFVSFSLLRHQTLNSRDPLSEMAIIVDITEFKTSVSSEEEIFQFDLPRPRPISTTAQSSYDFTSLRDRTKDILSVVVALLFGVGCGALTAATMYLAYSLCANRSSVYFGDEDDYGYDDDLDKENVKKMGYIKIPDDAAPVTAVV